MSEVLDVDIALIGGGVSGLWLLSRLRALGYGVLLVEGQHLGAGQSLRAQGLIHDAYQPLVSGPGGTTSADLPQTWQRCLEGQGEIDLRGVQVLTRRQYQWVCPPQGLRARLFGNLRRSRPPVQGEPLELEQYPPALRHDRFRGQIHALDEPVVEMASLLGVLARPHAGAMVLNQSHTVLARDGALTLRTPDQDPVVVRAQRIIAAAGANNGFITQVNTQLRPNLMVMVRGPNLPEDFHVHWLDGSEGGPPLIITSHRDREGRTVWYIGGQLAEEGGRSRSERHLQLMRKTLTGLLPWVDFSGSEWSSLRVEWAEPRQKQRDRPTRPWVSQLNRLITVWPVNLGMVPLMAEQVLKLLRQDGLRPQYRDLSLLDAWPRPLVGERPWNEPNRQWRR